MEELELLQEQRANRLETLVQAADALARIDRRIAFLKTDNKRHDSYE